MEASRDNGRWRNRVATLRFATIAGILVGCFAIGCACSSPRAPDTITAKVSDPESLVEVLSQHVPPGASLTLAQEFMQCEGFECTLYRNDTFQRNIFDSSGLQTSEPVDGDFLRCVRRHTKGFVTTVTTVAIFLDGDTVTEIMAKREFIGP